jgi:hypothetical protein
MAKIARPLIVVLACTILLGHAAVAGAQSPTKPGLLHRLEFSGVAGAAAVKNVGGTYGGELSLPWTDRITLFGEGMWMEDVVTRHRADVAAPITSALQASQGKPASGTVTAPAAYGGGGLRILLAQHHAIRPYVAFSAGAAHVAYTPVFRLAGANVTKSLPQYGVTLGRDLTGETTKAAFSGGAGIRIPKGRWSLDVGLRVTSIRTPNGPTNVSGLRAALGLKF